MRVMVIVKATDDSEKGIFPTAEAWEAMHTFNQELIDAGIRRIGEGLKPSSQGKRIAFDGPGRTVIEGPFSETRELVAGFWIWEVRDMDEAVAWGLATELADDALATSLKLASELAAAGCEVTPDRSDDVARLRGRRDRLNRALRDRGRRYARQCQQRDAAGPDRGMEDHRT